MCRIASLFLSQRLKGIMSGDARDISDIEKRDALKFFFLQSKISKEIRNFDRNIRITCTIICERQKVGGPV